MVDGSGFGPTSNNRGGQWLGSLQCQTTQETLSNNLLLGGTETTELHM